MLSDEIPDHTTIWRFREASHRAVSTRSCSPRSCT
nr:hypothetical protein [Bradyrhizobium sp. CCBAU 11434]